MFKRCLISALVAICLAMQSLPALACGGPLSANHSIRLQNAVTLLAWHNGIEHYMTNFTYSGAAKDFGWVLPLPAEPSSIEQGDVTVFSTLYEEAHKDDHAGNWFDHLFSRGSGAANVGGAQVLQKTKINSLNITVIKGSGPEIVDWATGNGFTVDALTRAHLLAYANASPIFMAAKYDTSSSQNQQSPQQNKNTGESTPVLLTMPTAHPWIPMELLAEDGTDTTADFYLLTDQPINIGSLQTKLGISPVNSQVPDAPGLQVRFQEQMSDALTDSLTHKTNMGWLWRGNWFTYLALSAPGEQVTYDLGISPSGVIHVAPFGTTPMAVVDHTLSQELPGWLPTLPPGSFPFLIVGLLILLGGGITLFTLRRRKRSKRSKRSKSTLMSKG